MGPTRCSPLSGAIAGVVATAPAADANPSSGVNIRGKEPFDTDTLTARHQSVHPGLGPVVGGAEEDGRVDAGAAQCAVGLEAVAVRQDHVQDDEVGAYGAPCRRPRRARGAA